MEIKWRAHKLLKPSLPSSSKVLHLSNLDQIMPAVPTTILFLFPYDGVSPDFMSTKVLESSLADLLVEFYPLAGRLRAFENSKMYIKCNDKGAEFTEAIATGQLSEVEVARPQGGNALLNPFHQHSQQPFSDMPLLQVQITRFACQGVALAVAFNHKLCDGQTSSFFMQKWMDVATGVRKLPAPVFNHPKLASPKVHSVPNYIFPLNTVKWVRAPHIAIRQFTFDMDFVRNSFSGTHFEALAAHLWQSVTKARCLAPEQVSQLAFAVDARRKFSPPLPEGLCGNVVVPAVTQARVQDLLDGDLAISLVRKALRAVDEDFVKFYLAEIELGKMAGGLPPGFNALHADLVLTNWRAAPLLNFGWGKANCITLPEPPANSGALCVILPHSQAHKTDVCVMGLPHEQMERLESDAEFLYTRDLKDSEIQQLRSLL